MGVTCPSLSCLLADLLTRGTEKEATRMSWVLILYLFSCALVSWGEPWSPLGDEGVADGGGQGCPLSPNVLWTWWVSWPPAPNIF